MKSVRGRLTYANVVSTIALFLVLGGGTAFAARALAANSVGTQQLKQDAVTTAKLRNAAVSAAKLANGSVAAAKLGNGSVTTAKLRAGAVGTSDNSPTVSVTAAKLAAVPDPRPRRSCATSAARDARIPESDENPGPGRLPPGRT